MLRKIVLCYHCHFVHVVAAAWSWPALPVVGEPSDRPSLCQVVDVAPCSRAVGVGSPVRTRSHHLGLWVVQRRYRRVVVVQPVSWDSVPASVGYSPVLVEDGCPRLRYDLVEDGEAVRGLEVEPNVCCIALNGCWNLGYWVCEEVRVVDAGAEQRLEYHPRWSARPVHEHPPLKAVLYVCGRQVVACVQPYIGAAVRLTKVLPLDIGL